MTLVTLIFLCWRPVSFLPFVPESSRFRTFPLSLPTSPNFAPMDPATSLVLITGISGFLGAEVAVQFLRAGFKIRGTVRKQTQADAFLLMYGEEFPGMIEVVIVERLDVKDAFEKAVKDVTAIMHIASPLPLIAKVRRIARADERGC